MTAPFSGRRPTSWVLLVTALGVDVWAAVWWLAGGAGRFTSALYAPAKDLTAALGVAPQHRMHAYGLVLAVITVVALSLLLWCRRAPSLHRWLPPVLAVLVAFWAFWCGLFIYALSTDGRAAPIAGAWAFAVVVIHYLPSRER